MPNASAKLSIFLLALYSSLILAIAAIPAGCEIRGLGFLTEIKPTFQSLLHIPAFMVLAVLFLSVIKAYSFAAWKAVFFTLGFALMFGLIIEGVQFLVPGRTVSLSDIMLDLIGAMLGILIYFKRQKLNPHSVKNF